ncbi:LysR family transcriptional regulator [Vibrio mexicanus]|uniref:LysR family transcriptional regulator n=1 Tax=Vibrio mexicanus TaxID=1004326 RepID=UPI00063C822F|nr:LysR family transcriptional regulator [Vibrio mexicanus]
MKNTELNLIPVFVAIYEECSLSKAAARLEISQPAVSKALARLRDIYEDSLFHRSSSGVEPTSFAAEIYPAMATALKNFQSTLSSSRDFDPTESNRVYSIACLASIANHLMPTLFNAMRQISPNVRLEVHPLFTADYEADLRLEKYDLIIDMEPMGRSVLKHEVIAKGNFAVCCRADHPRIQGEVTLEDFYREEHIAIARWHNRQHVMTSLGIEPLEKRKVAYTSPGVMEAIPMLEVTDCLAFLPSFCITYMQQLYNIKAYPVPFEMPNQNVAAIWHPSRNQDASHQWLRTKLIEASNSLEW